METRWVRTIHMGLKSLLLHKLRSGLTVLGIVFGVCSVIAMLAIGEGSKREALEQIEGLGATNIIVRSIKPPEGTFDTRSRILEYGLTLEDYDRLVSTVPGVTQALPIWELRRELRSRHRTIPDGRAVATTPLYLSMNSIAMYRGRFLTQEDLDQFKNVAVLAYEVAEKLFPVDDPIGEAVNLNNEFYRIVGVCASRAPSAAIGGSLAAQEYDKDIYIPLTTARLRFGEINFERRAGQFILERFELSQVTVSVASMEEVEPTAEVIRDLIGRYHLRPDFGVTVPLELLRKAEYEKMIFNVVLGSVAAISLLVGGIGIMNIMLATVTERTREIGIRRALGAKRRDITIQFLGETMVLSSLGGLLGLALGVGLAYLLEQGAGFLGVPLPSEISVLGWKIATRWLVAAASGFLLAVGGLLIFAARLAQRGLRPMVLLEGVGLLVGGALVGTVIGVGLPYLITDLVHYMAPPDFSVRAIVNPWSLPLAFGISVAIGIVFGLYPARRAAMMDPIEALRHE